MKNEYSISIDRDENNVYIWEIRGLPACYTQAKTIPELLSRMVEVSEWSVEILKNLDLENSKKFNVSLQIDYA